MMPKYFVTLNENQTIGMKFDTFRSVVIIGGLARFNEEIENVIINFFEEAPPNPEWPQRNKIKYTFKYKHSEFLIVVRRLREYGVHVQKTDTLLRIMR